MIILAAAILGKAAGPLIIGPRLGFSTREALALAALLNTRGLVELVVLNIGLESGLLPLPLFAMLVVMALGTTAMTSPLLRRLGYPSDRHVARSRRRREICVGLSPAIGRLKVRATSSLPAAAAPLQSG